MSRFSCVAGSVVSCRAGDLSSQSTDKLYRRIKADELPAEQIETSALVQQPEQMPGNPAAPSSRVVIERVIRHLAEASGQDANLVEDDTQRTISILHSSTTWRPTSNQSARHFGGMDASRPYSCSSHDMGGDFARICDLRGQKQVAWQTTSPALLPPLMRT
ncbi:hypothetical protein [Bradyrhizobium canariense]|uniref:hypothetical protein n=1 Tax=Bradyrhizobium canariense TaxID=255045 RepID=UPI0011BABC35|nr:hypothetical protein [Bradyrhizobium canariense]